MKDKFAINRMCCCRTEAQEILSNIASLFTCLHSQPEIMLSLLAVTMWHLEEAGEDGEWQGVLSVSQQKLLFTSSIKSAGQLQRGLPSELAGLFADGAVRIVNSQNLSVIEINETGRFTSGQTGDAGTGFWRLVSEGLQYALNANSKLQKERQELMHELLETDKGVLALIEETVSRLTGGLAHEINNPLAYIRLNAEYIRRTAAQQKEGICLGEEQKKALDAVFGGIDRVTRIIDGLKLYARHGKTRKEAFDLAECVSDAWKLLADPVDGTVKCQIDIPEPISLVGSRQQIEQVFINLLSNSVKAIASQAKAGGQIAVRAKDAHNGGVTIEVMDNGGGIAGKDIRYIFEPFFTTDRSKGVGLGLSIVRGIIVEHGGSIVPSVDGDWTVFTIQLPDGIGECNE